MTEVWMLVIGLNTSVAVVSPYPSMEMCLQVGNNWVTRSQPSLPEMRESQNSIPMPRAWATCLPGFR